MAVERNVKLQKQEELSIARKIGRESEKRIAEALAALKEDGLINHFRKAKHSDDAKGIDFWIFTDLGRMPLQVKSSWNGKMRFDEKLRCDFKMKKHSDAIVIHKRIPSTVSALSLERNIFWLLKEISGYFTGRNA